MQENETTFSDSVGSPEEVMPAAPSISVGVTAEVAEQWSWAAAHARIPQISALTLSLPEALENVRVAVTVEDGPEVFGSTIAVEGPLGAGVTTPRSVHVPLSARAMAGVDERRAGECVIRVEDRATGSLLGEYRQAVDIQPRDLWSWSGDPRRKEQIARLIVRGEDIIARLHEIPPGHEAETLQAELVALKSIIDDLSGSRHDLAQSLLASFVRPNHPDVLALATEAAAVKAKQTGDGSFSAFQRRDPGEAERAVESSVSAIYDALRARQITYSEPPPRWDYAREGQRIRDHAAVAGGGLGTCMDTTVLMAAVIEHVGLNPVMVLLPGHIAVGYWRRDPYPSNVRPEWFPGTPVIRDSMEIRKLLEGGWLGVIETTTFTAGHRVSADEARGAVRDAVAGGLAADDISLIDVAEARKAGVSPLPAVQERADGVTEVIEYRPGGARDVTEVPTPTREATGERIIDAHPPRYRTWKSSLFALNARNALLNLGSGPSVQPLVLPPSGLGELEDRLNQDVEFELLSGYSIPEVYRAREIYNAAVLESDDVLRLLGDRRLYVQRISQARSSAGPISTTKFASEIRSMARRAKEAHDERGMNPLFLCLGALRWPLKDRSGAVASAPLILVPVKIAVRRGGGFVLSLDTSAQTTPNAALIEWLRREYDLVIPSLSEPAADRAGIDVDAVLADVRNAIAARGLALDVASTASLALLDLAAFRMWQDLNIHGDTFLRHPLVDHLVHTPTEAFADAAVTASVDADADSQLDALITPIPADATQKRAVVWAREGRSFVLQGPPGTGKSQTITNMIAECLLAGRKVLFVAEKGTALSVVQRRLDAVGLGPFTLNLHHDGSTATQVRAQLKAALTTRVAPDPAAMESAQRKLRNARYELGEFPEKLHRRNAAGLSAYSARDKLLVLGDGPAVDVPRDLIAARAELVREVRDALTRLQPLAGAAGARVGHPWRLAGRAPEGEVDVEKASSVVRKVVEAAQWAETTTGPLRALLDGISEPAQFGRLAALSNPALPSGDVLRAVLETHWSAATSTAIAGAENAVREWLPSLRGFAPDVLEIDLHGVAEELRQAKESSIFGRSKRQEAAARRLQPYAPGAAELSPVAAEQALPSLIAAQQTGAAILANMSALPGIYAAAGWNPFRAGAFESVHAQFNALVDLTMSARVTGTWDDAARAAAIAGDLSGENARLVELAANWTALWTAVGATQTDAAAWAQGASLLEAVRSHGDTWLRHADHERLIPLQRWLALVAALQPLATAGLVSTREEILDGRIRVDELEDAFDRGVAQASLTERVVVEGLDRFDSRAHDERVRTYAAAEGDVRREWVTAGPSQLLTSRGGGGMGLKTGGLARELEKTRQRLGTRAILRRYGDAVQELTPLVLCSPASAVDLIEPGVMEFDLVIFDEASQITVPEAIGAIARARAVVVVGDSKQMPPSRRVGTQTAAEEEFDDSGDEEIVEDQESILSECELARVPTLSLSWHYRSQDEALIAFSNRAYYNGGLSSFPTPSLLSSTTGLQFVPVDGQFIRTSSRETVDMGRGVVAGKGTNPVEARAVVDAVASLLAADNAPTIGIVTFNEQQRLLIEDLLRASDDPNINAAMDENAMGPSDVLFIKALEQVQGDERDVVLFSVAFSKQGERIPLNFGPLSNSGGERRLNVAVTRARLKNMVFCSFDPEHLEADSASFRGVKDLKDFLRFAKASAGSDATQVIDRTPIRDRHRDEVAAALRDAGVHVRVDVGMSDFRLDLVLSRGDQPDRPVLPVLLDGESWRSRHTVADRDVLPVEVLTGLMGWPSVARVWWPMWLQNRDEVIARLREEFDAADAALVERPEESTVVAEPQVGVLVASAHPAAPMEAELSPLRSESPIAAVPLAVAYDPPEIGRAPASPGTAAQPVEAAVIDELSAPIVPVTPIDPVAANLTDQVRSDDVPEVRGGVRVFVPAPSVSAGSRETLDHLSERRPAAAVREQLLDIIEAEGPIEVGRLIRLTARRFDLLKVRAAREEEIRRLIPRGVIRKSRLGDFAWPEGLDPETWQGYRLPDEPPSRGLDEVAPEELLNAMRSIVSDAPGIDDESAIRATARLFGISKLGALVRARLEAVAAKLRLESGE